MTENKIYDSIVIGGGPSGVTSAIYNARFGLDTALIDFRIGGNVFNTSYVENYPGYESTTGEELSQDYERHLLSAFENTGKGELIRSYATNVEKEGELYKVTTLTNDTLYSRTVTLATGTTHKRLGVPGEESLGDQLSNCAVCDGIFFKGGDILVIGSGDSAYTEGHLLAEAYGKTVAIVTNKPKDKVKAQQYLQDKFNDLPNTRVFYNYETESFTVGEDGLIETVLIDGFMHDRLIVGSDAVFTYVGINANTEIIKDLVELDEQGFAINSEENTGIYVAGDPVKGNIRQITNAMGSGVEASYKTKEYLDNLEES